MSRPTTGKGPPASGSRAPRDRRAQHRAAIEIPAVLHAGDREIGGSIRDLGIRGVALTIKESLAPGMMVRVSFRLPNARQPLEVAGVLVRASSDQGRRTIGLEFVQPDSDTLRTIETFVERNRTDSPFSARRRRRGPDTARVVTGESAAALEGIYKKAVDEVAEKKGKSGGLLSRWLRRGKS